MPASDDELAKDGVYLDYAARDRQTTSIKAVALTATDPSVLALLVTSPNGMTAGTVGLAATAAAGTGATATRFSCANGTFSYN